MPKGTAIICAESNIKILRISNRIHIVKPLKVIGYDPSYLNLLSALKAKYCPRTVKPYTKKPLNFKTLAVKIIVVTTL